MFEETDLVFDTKWVSSNISYKSFKTYLFTDAKFLLWSQKLWLCKPGFILYYG
jgi:hypothetical protein